MARSVARTERRSAGTSRLTWKATTLLVAASMIGGTALGAGPRAYAAPTFGAAANVLDADAWDDPGALDESSSVVEPVETTGDPALSTVSDDQNQTPLAKAAAPGTTVCDGPQIFEDLGISKNGSFPVPDGYSDANGEQNNPYGKPVQTMYVTDELFIHWGPDRVNNSVAEQGQLFGHNKNFWSDYDAGGVHNVSNSAADNFDAYVAVPGNFKKGGTTKAQMFVLGANTQRDKGGGASDRSLRGLYGYFMDTNAQETPIFPIYADSIGTGYERDRGYLRYDANQDKNNGWSLTEGYYNPYLLYNHMQAVAFDMDADGIDEIAIYVPAPDGVANRWGIKPHVRILKYKGYGDWYDRNSWDWTTSDSAYTFLGSDSWTMNRISMVAADFNDDGKEDLAIMGTLAYYQNEGKLEGNYGGRMSVLISRPGSAAPVWLTYYNGNTAQQNSLFVGDLDNEGHDSLYAAQAEYTDISNQRVKSKISLIKYAWNFDLNGGVGGFEQMSVPIYPEVADLSTDVIYPHVRADAVAVSKGPGRGDAMYFHGLIWWMDEGALTRGPDQKVDYGTFSLSKAPATVYAENKNINSVGDGVYQEPEKGHWSLGYSDTDAWFEYNITATGLDNDLIDEIVIHYVPVDTDNDGPNTQPSRVVVLKYSPLINYIWGVKHHLFESREKDHLFNGSQMDNMRHQKSTVFAATPDTDNDTVQLTYKTQYMKYSDPEVMAVIAGAPLWKDFENSIQTAEDYYGYSGTSLGFSEGRGKGSMFGGTFKAGVYVSFEWDASILGIIPVGQSEFEASADYEMTHSTENVKTITHSVAYATKSYHDQVAVYSVPIAQYVYDAKVPTNYTGGYKTTEMVVNVPFKPAVEVMDVDKFDAIVTNCKNVMDDKSGPAGAQTWQLYPIKSTGDGPLQHNAGEPFSYPRSVSAARALFSPDLIASENARLGIPQIAAHILLGKYRSTKKRPSARNMRKRFLSKLAAVRDH